MSAWASPAARSVRSAVFATFAREGRAPAPAELARELALGPDEVAAALRELHDAHALVLTAEGDAIRMAHPFSAWPMGFVVRGGERLWWGGCAWDSFGIVAALGETLEITTTCPATGDVLQYTAGPQTPPDAPGVVVRIPLPAARWWDDVVATCTAIRAYSSADVVTGTLVPLEQLWRLALVWYGDRLDPDWAPRPVEHSQALLDEVGLDGSFWALPR